MLDMILPKAKKPTGDLKILHKPNEWLWVGLQLSGDLLRLHLWHQQRGDSEAA